MATIRSYGPLRQARVEATAFLAVYHNGRLRRSGRGLPAWYSAAGSTALVEIPADDREQIVQINATTRDFQVVSVQGAATWRAAEPLTLAERIDFSIDLRKGVYRADPLAQIESLVGGVMRIAVERHIAARTLAEVVDQGLEPLASAVVAELAAAGSLAAIGIAVTNVRVSGFSPAPELVRALRQPTLERLQQAADEATFARRAAAVEKEAAIAQNETRAKIRLEEERSRLIARERDNELARAQAKAEADPKDFQTRLDLAMTYWAAEQRQEAIDELLAMIKLDRNWNEAAARQQLLKFFEALGFTDPLSVDGRKRLSTILFS